MHPKIYANGASGLCSGPNLPPCRCAFCGCGTTDTSFALIGMPDVLIPSKCPIVMFHPKCHPSPKERLPLRNTLSAAAVPPTTRFINPTQDAPGEVAWSKAKRLACNKTEKVIATEVDAPKVTM
eukprot:4459469-Ditylum_brightwellii.AAC.1